VQISDDNVHLVRDLCDEIFGVDNYVSQIVFKKTISSSSGQLPMVNDYLIWYGKNKANIKFRRLFRDRTIDELKRAYQYVERQDGTVEKVKDGGTYSNVDIFFNNADLTSQGATENSNIPYTYEGNVFYPSGGRHWSTTAPEGLDKLTQAQRLYASGNTLCYRRKATDFPYFQFTSIWDDSLESTFSSIKIYVVQTTPKAIARCLLMTTDPGDLVLDITCGSGTTAYVAEQWGRRWITCDTSRVAVILTKQRLMTGLFDYYKLAHPNEGVSSGFVYKSIPHITLKSIANGEPPEVEMLYDQPEKDSNKTRISGPFTVEAVPSQRVRSFEDIEKSSQEADVSVARSGATLRQNDWIAEILSTGIRGKGGQMLEFARIETLGGTRYLHAEGETKEGEKIAISFGPEYAPLEQRQVELAIDEAQQLVPKPKLVIFSAFQFDPEAAKDIDELRWPGVDVLKAQMNTDLLTADLKKKRASNESFWLMGQPDVELKKQGNKYAVIVNGFDYYNTKTGEIESGDSSKIAMWELDTDYDGRSLYPRQVFFPIAGSDEGWSKLAKNLKAQIDEGLIENYRGTTSLPFKLGSNKQVAVKIIDDRGIESLKIIRVTE
jgi:adenine-specific DNA-methyltransferase